jgi:hypothetical protein
MIQHFPDGKKPSRPLALVKYKYSFHTIATLPSSGILWKKAATV